MAGESSSVEDHDPSTAMSARASAGDGPGRTPLEVFERIYLQDPDPWNYETSAYELAKYDRTLAALGTRRYSRALEVGCSIGVLTAKLAPRCVDVVALEPSPTALARARERLRGEPHVELRLGAIPEGIPAGPFDLVICSEVLYYLGQPVLLEALRAIEERLAPGGVLVAVHFRRGRHRLSRANVRRRRSSRPNRARPTPCAPLSGDQVHVLLHSHTRLALTHSECDEAYRLERFDKRA
jgi:SAM-dependent methyltransferase